MALKSPYDTESRSEDECWVLYTWPKMSDVKHDNWSYCTICISASIIIVILDSKPK